MIGLSKNQKWAAGAALLFGVGITIALAWKYGYNRRTEPPCSSEEHTSNSSHTIPQQQEQSSLHPEISASTKTSEIVTINKVDETDDQVKTDENNRIISEEEPSQETIANIILDVFKAYAAGKKFDHSSIELNEDVITETAEKHYDDCEMMKGAILYCQSIREFYEKRQSNSEPNANPQLWKLEESLCKLFKVYNEVDSIQPLRLKKIKKGFGASHFPIVDLSSAQFKPNQSIENQKAYFIALSEYLKSAHEYNRHKFAEIEIVATFSIGKELTEIRKYVNEFMIKQNELRYPNFMKDFESALLALAKDLQGKVNHQIIESTHANSGSIYRINSVFNSYLDSDLSPQLKDRMLDLIIHQSVIDKMTEELVDFSSITYDANVLKVYKATLTEAAAINNKNWYIYFASGETSPNCSSEGKWDTALIIKPSIISSKSIKECKDAIDKYCAQNPGKSAQSAKDAIYDKLDNMKLLLKKLESKAIDSFAYKTFN